ncbi:MAG: carbon-nitrogen hydrolase family protein [Candidatus Limnocylindria bacterium]
MPTHRVAACQIDPKLGEVEANLERISRAVQEAAAAGAVLAVLPEAAVTGYAFGSLEEARPVARRAGAVAQGVLAGLAEAHRMTIICGTLEAQGDELFNAALVATPDGRRYTYRKMHLPYLGVDRFTTPGPDAPSVFDAGGIRIGVLICYDLRFPEAARMCALDGADLIALPTNWPVGVDFHPGIFAPSRAAENHCYLLACDRVGTERGTTFIGRSVLVDYDGHQLAVASDTEEELLVGEIDAEAARHTHVRRRPGEHEWDTMADRRPGLYRRLLEPAVDRERPSSANLYSHDVD